ncbi:hypothetical protein EU527_12255 [Candidatus Thorarchaeota archaeon]|nr:MAG: hypothetical protein EU527_12255 [Candidatus Thorarchaeota archaeon]
MKTKLFIEPKGKAREQVQLESSIPLDIDLFRKWSTSWIPVKDFKKWNKENWDDRALGELREGKIFEAIDVERSTPLKGDLVAFRSYVIDNSGAKKKHPMILIAKLKNTLEFNFFKEHMTLDSEQEKEIREALKGDFWVPISVYQPQLVDRRQVIEVADVLTQAIQYLNALMNRDPASEGLPKFVETEILTK